MTLLSRPRRRHQHHLISNEDALAAILVPDTADRGAAGGGAGSAGVRLQGAGQYRCTGNAGGDAGPRRARVAGLRSEEHTSELQSLMRSSYAVFCLKKKKTKNLNNTIRLTDKK